MSFAQGGGTIVNSTVIGKPKSDSERVRELEALVAELLARERKREEQGAPPTEPQGASSGPIGVPNAAQGGPIVNPDSRSRPEQQQQNQQQVNNLNTSQNVSSRSYSSLDSSLWRSRLPQSLVTRANATTVITKEQLTRRKTGTELPAFNGDPFIFLRFIEKFLNTCGDKCGFTAQEDMDRIMAALKEPARALVSSYTYSPDNLDRVVDRLTQAYRQPAMLLEAVTKRVEDLPRLKDDMSNISHFSGEVDQVRNVANMMDDVPVDTCLILKLERKLPLLVADKWLDFKGPNSVGTIHQMADFLLEQHARMIALHRTTSDKGSLPTRKTLLLVQESEEVDQPEGAVAAVRRGNTTRSPRPWRPRRKQQASAAIVGEELCILKCQAKHPLHLCPAFKELPTRHRWNVATNNDRCFLCLGPHLRRYPSSKLLSSADESHLLPHPTCDRAVPRRV